MHYGLDVGGTKMEFAMLDRELHRLATYRRETPGHDYEAFLTAIADMIAKADRTGGVKGSLGIGMPGFVGGEGRATSSNIPCINGRRLLTDLTERLDRPVAFENDTNALIISEVNGGAARGMKHALGVVIGTGLASGLCIDGEIYHGSRHRAGECGHTPLPAPLQQRYELPLRPCGCGLVGCVEQYLTGPGLLWLSGHFGGEYPSVQALLEDLRHGQGQAGEIFAAYMDCLGCFFAQLCLNWDPDVIVLGGGLSAINEIYRGLPAGAARYLFAGYGFPALAAPAFGGASGARGAAILGRRLVLEA